MTQNIPKERLENCLGFFTKFAVYDGVGNLIPAAINHTITEALQSLLSQSALPEKDDNGLLPCPFCGSQAELITWHEHTEARHIRCKDCKCMTGKSHFMREHAFNDWNTRAALTPSDTLADWQPIEQGLPTDGRIHLVYGKFKNPISLTNGTDTGTFDTFYDISGYRNMRNSWNCEIKDPDKRVTHWKPITPPEALAAHDKGE